MSALLFAVLPIPRATLFRRFVHSMSGGYRTLHGAHGDDDHLYRNAVFQHLRDHVCDRRCGGHALTSPHGCIVTRAPSMSFDHCKVILRTVNWSSASIMP